jgi:hypothetical protein
MSWKDSNLQPDRYELEGLELQPDRYELKGLEPSNQAVMSEPLRLRKERIFPAYGTKGLNVPARHAVLSNESEMLCGDLTFEHRCAC